MPRLASRSCRRSNNEVICAKMRVLWPSDRNRGNQRSRNSNFPDALTNRSCTEPAAGTSPSKKWYGWFRHWRNFARSNKPPLPLTERALRLRVYKCACHALNGVQMITSLRSGMSFNTKSFVRRRRKGRKTRCSRWMMSISSSSDSNFEASDSAASSSCGFALSAPSSMRMLGGAGSANHCSKSSKEPKEFGATNAKRLHSSRKEF
mmetsp:Transcript_20974/g.60592  ORF Transcript_20974/g.60592 Transcript_20974/m.60592 type:complete len:206 (-) Transcript_20974:1183-1800(-)